MGLEDLSHIHAGRYPERIQNNVHRSSVGKERHVLFWNNPCHHTFISVTSGHLVSDRNLPLGRNINLHLLQDAGINIFPGFQTLKFEVLLIGQLVELLFVTRDDLADLDPDRTRVDFDVIVDIRYFAQQRLSDLTVSRDDNFPGLSVDHIQRNLFVQQDIGESLSQLFFHLCVFLDVFVIHSLGVTLGFAWSELDHVFLDRATCGLHIHHDSCGTGGYDE